MAGFLDKVKDFIKKDPSKADQAIEKVGDFVDNKTEGKYASTVDKIQEVAKNAAQKASGSE
jgi:hypothetical protein